MSKGIFQAELLEIAHSRKFSNSAAKNRIKLPLGVIFLFYFPSNSPLVELTFTHNYK
jgi:hypothetical protein